MLSIFALSLLLITAMIDYQQKKQIKQSKKYDYLFTERRKRAEIKSRHNKGL